MKKNLMLFTFLVFIGFIPKAEASFDACASLNEQGNPTCLTLCSYEFNNTDLFFNITYDFKSDKLLYGGSFYHGGINGGAIVTATEDFNVSDVLIMNRDLKKEVLNKGLCPKYVYVDNNLTKEFCFDNDGIYCKSVGKDLTTDFNDTKNNGILSFDIKDRITNFFNSYAFNETMVLDTNYNLENELENDISKKLLYDEHIPSFMTKKDEYINGFEVLKENYTKYSSNILKKYETKSKNGDITEEEFINIKETINTNNKNNLKSIENVREAINFNQDNDLDFSGDYNECTTYLGDGTKGTPMYYLKFVFNLIKYGAILLFLVLTILEFLKAVTSDKDDSIKKATALTLKRLIIAVIVFLLPVLIEFTFELLDISGSGTCGIK